MDLSLDTIVSVALGLGLAAAAGFRVFVPLLVLNLAARWGYVPLAAGWEGVGGTPALEQDSIHSLFDKLPLMVVLLITTTTILMFLAFGSVVLPIKAALMSALTLGSTMGILTWMFVEGHGSGLMNYTPQPLMAPMIGLIIAVIWGLSTDYEVFLVSRMVEARERGMSTTEAIRIGTATRLAVCRTGFLELAEPNAHVSECLQRLRHFAGVD